MYEQGVSRNQILGELSRSAHGKLAEYSPIVSEACRVDPEFIAKLIAWDFINGQVKDTKVALPILTLAERQFPVELLENSLAHLALQPPRELLKALKFSMASDMSSNRRSRLEGMIRAYLTSKQADPGKWARLAVRHRRSLKTLYKVTHCGCPEWVSVALFGDVNKIRAPYVPGSIFADIANLHRMEPAQMAVAIQKWHLSPLVVSGAMAGAGAKKDASQVVQAGMEQMSDTELITRAKGLEKQGLNRDGVLRETFRKKVSKATKSTKATLKTGVAADEVEDEGLKTMLKELQERQIASQKSAGRGIDGNWLVISDKSGSQQESIELGKEMAAVITKFVGGKVWLLFCDSACRSGIDATGKTLEQIKNEARYILANGGTSYGTGLDWIISKGLQIDGVVIIGDGGENTPPIFANSWRTYEKMHSKQLPVYWYRTAGSDSPENFRGFMRGASIPVTEFDVSHGKVDYYSLPNLVQTMNANAFGVVDKIMAVPLLTFEMVGLDVKTKKLVTA